MKPILRYIPSILFNVVETMILLGIGYYIGLSIYQIVTIMIVFCTVRNILGGAMHYKDWYRCLLWTGSLFASIFMITKLNVWMGIGFSILAGFIMTQKANNKLKEDPS